MEISKAKFMEQTGLSRTRYAADLEQGLIPQPMKTPGGHFRHLQSDIETYHIRRRSHLKRPKTTNEVYKEALRKVKPVTL